MAEPQLVPARPAWPTEVTLAREDLAEAHFTPRELRLIKEQLGRTYTAIVTDEESDDKYLVVAWLKLRRDGYTLDLAQMDDILIRVKPGTESELGPMSGDPSTGSPPSAGSGE